MERRDRSTPPAPDDDEATLDYQFSAEDLDFVPAPQQPPAASVPQSNSAELSSQQPGPSGLNVAPGGLNIPPHHHAQHPLLQVSPSQDALGAPSEGQGFSVGDNESQSIPPGPLLSPPQAPRPHPDQSRSQPRQTGGEVEGRHGGHINDQATQPERRAARTDQAAGSRQGSSAAATNNQGPNHVSGGLPGIDPQVVARQQRILDKATRRIQRVPGSDSSGPSSDELMATSRRQRRAPREEYSSVPNLATHTQTSRFHDYQTMVQTESSPSDSDVGQGVQGTGWRRVAVVPKISSRKQLLISEQQAALRKREQASNDGGASHSPTSPPLPPSQGSASDVTSERHSGSSGSSVSAGSERSSSEGGPPSGGRWTVATLAPARQSMDGAAPPVGSLTGSDGTSQSPPSQESALQFQGSNSSGQSFSSSSGSNDSAHDLSGRLQLVSLAPPVSGPESDATTVYPATETASSSGSSENSTSMTTFDSSSQPPSLTLPVSSTPVEDDGMPPPKRPSFGSQGLLPHPPPPRPPHLNRKRSSEDTSTSTSTTSGEVVKHGSSQLLGFPQSMHTGSEPASYLDHSPPLAPQSPTPPRVAPASQLPGEAISIPSTLPFGEDCDEGGASNAADENAVSSQSQTMEDTVDSQYALANEIPGWLEADKVAAAKATAAASAKEGSESQDRGSHQDSSSSSSTSDESQVMRPPPPKRSRTSRSRSSSGLPEWINEGASSSHSSQHIRDRNSSTPSSQRAPSSTRHHPESGISSSSSSSSGTAMSSSHSSSHHSLSPELSSPGSGAQTSSSSSSGGGGNASSSSHNTSTSTTSSSSSQSSGNTSRSSGDGSQGSGGNDRGSGKDGSRGSGDGDNGSQKSKKNGRESSAHSQQSASVTNVPGGEETASKSVNSTLTTLSTVDSQDLSLPTQDSFLKKVVPVDPSSGNEAGLSSFDSSCTASLGLNRSSISEPPPSVALPVSVLGQGEESIEVLDQFLSQVPESVPQDESQIPEKKANILDGIDRNGLGTDPSMNLHYSASSKSQQSDSYKESTSRSEPSNSSLAAVTGSLEKCTERSDSDASVEIPIQAPVDCGNTPSPHTETEPRAVVQDNTEAMEVDASSQVSFTLCLSPSQAEPCTSSTDLRPVPLYESLVCESQFEGGGSASQCNPAQGSAANESEGGSHAVPVAAGDRVQDISPPSLEVSQQTSSGTPFNLQLPQTTLPLPTARLTPPSQQQQQLSSSRSSSSNNNSDGASAKTHSGSSTPLLSPSELNSSIFCSISSEDQATTNDEAKSKGKDGGTSSSTHSRVPEDPPTRQDSDGPKSSGGDVAVNNGAKGPTPPVSPDAADKRSTTPRKCLSLRKNRNGTPRNKRAPQAISTESDCQQQLTTSAPQENSTSSAFHKANQAFVQEENAEERSNEQQLSNSLHFNLPVVSVPSESQLEMSEDFAWNVQNIGPSVQPVAPVSSHIAGLLAGHDGGQEGASRSGMQEKSLKPKSVQVSSSDNQTSAASFPIQVATDSMASNHNPCKPCPSSLITSASTHNQPCFTSTQHAQILQSTSAISQPQTSLPAITTPSPRPSLPPLEFTSPIGEVSQAQLQMLQNQLGSHISSYRIHRVRRTVFEQRVVSEVEVRDQKVVEGSLRVWQESVEPQYFQEDTILLPDSSSLSQQAPVTSSSAQARVTTPQLQRTSTAITPVRIATQPILRSPSIVLPIIQPQRTCSASSVQPLQPASAHVLSTSPSLQSATATTSSLISKQPSSLISAQPPNTDASSAQPPNTDASSAQPPNTDASSAQHPNTDASSLVPAQSNNTNHQTRVDLISTPSSAAEPSHVSVCGSASTASGGAADAGSIEEVVELDQETPLPKKTKSLKLSRSAKKAKRNNSLKTPNSTPRRSASETPQKRGSASPKKNLSSSLRKSLSGSAKKSVSGSAKKSVSVKKTPSPSLKKSVSGSAKKTQTRSQKALPGPRQAAVSGAAAAACDESVAGPSGEGGEGGVCVGRVVMAQYRDKFWYVGNVDSMTKNGRYAIDYADGEKGIVSKGCLFPLEQVKPGVAVAATSSFDEDHSEINGLFAGFVGSSNESFFLEPAGGDGPLVECAVERLCLAPASGQACLEPATKCGVKRSRTTAIEEPATKRRRGVSPPSPQRERETTTLEDDVPLAQRRLFEGYSFLLTQRPKDDQRPLSPAAGPVDKETTAAQITSRKGKILETIGDERIIKDRFFVLSNNHCRTKKFLLGLALNLPCVSYQWIEQCIQEGRVVDCAAYRLPVGVPLGATEPLPWQPRGRRAVLRDVKIHVQGRNDFKNHWVPIVEKAGATVFSKLPSATSIARSNDELCDLVIVREGSSRLPYQILNLSDKGVQLVRPEWVVQCLVQGRALLDDIADFLIVAK